MAFCSIKDSFLFRFTGFIILFFPVFVNERKKIKNEKLSLDRKNQLCYYTILHYNGESATSCRDVYENAVSKRKIFVNFYCGEM